MKRYWVAGISILEKNKPIVLTLMALAVLADILYLPGSSDVKIFGLLVAYGVAVRFYEIESKVTFLWCLVLLGVMFVEFLFTGPSVVTEKAAVWLVLFLTFGILQQWRE